MTPPWSPPDEHTWKILLEAALRIIDSLKGNGYGKLDFRLGSGKVLMFRFDHRISKDIDIFTYDAQALAYLTPRLNRIAESVTTTYQEQANALKLTLPDGDIDFIVAAPVIADAPREIMQVARRIIELDATSEILAKKLAYRADGFTARDVFDMCVALALDRPSALAALAATRHTRPALLDRLERLAGIPDDELGHSLRTRPKGRPHVPGMVRKLAEMVTIFDKQAGSRPNDAARTRGKRDGGTEI